jgi:hypothetical protein
MPWQAQVVNVALEVERNGLPAYREVRVKVPRQSGKTTVVWSVELDRCLYWGLLQRCLYAAQDRNNSRLKWEEQADFLNLSPLATAIDVRRQTGLERIIVPATGGSIGITASGETSGHGFYLDLGVVDEAWAQKDERLSQAFRPAMMTRPAAQMWVLSTEGTDESMFLNDRCEDGRARVEAGSQSGVAYFEWSAGDDDNPDEEQTWWDCMPALGRTVPIEVIRADHDVMDPAEFSRAYLNRRAPAGLTVIPISAWLRGRDEHSRLSGVPRFAIDTTPNREWTSVAAAGWAGPGRVHVEVIEHREGTPDWVPGRMAELQRRWGAEPVIVDPASPAGSLLLDLAANDVRTDPVTAREMTAACGQFYDAVVSAQPTVAHLGQPVLNTAVAAARKRVLGDSWAWARKVGGDISPLVAVTLARYALVRAGEGTFKIG